ncbi:MAG: hypothetical protein OHK93_000950 [Ramalina farinacea]|uniref:Phosphoglycerate mutase-like protein n=1 Tax=Ramalina farinacea TaxID=258253 RepID=A0AA43TZ17_9LECA|nr:hypothetical protein [Ramalina farinacea]
MKDPLLTPFGEKQCHDLAQSFPDHESIDLLVCSPLRRTIYTTLLAFSQDLDRCGNVIALPEAQETADVPCDTGSDVSALRQEMADKPVDLSRITDDWNCKIGRWAPIAKALEKRAKEVRQWLKARPEKGIVLVTHGGFVHYFTEDWTGYKESMGHFTRTGWANVEHRSYTFTDDDDDEAHVHETSSSRERRKGTEKPLTSTERMELRETTGKPIQKDAAQPLQAKA